MGDVEEKKPQRARITFHLDDCVVDFNTRTDRISYTGDNIQFFDMQKNQDVFVPYGRLLYYTIKELGEL